MEKKRREKEKEKAEYIENEKRRRLDKLKQCIKNKEEINNELNQYRSLILSEQKEILNRGINKDSLNNLKKLNANDQIVKQQLTIENNMRAFKKKMHSIQSASILKKSPEERLNMYKEKKREEAERKKKELEDKMQKEKNDSFFIWKNYLFFFLT